MNSFVVSFILGSLIATGVMAGTGVLLPDPPQPAGATRYLATRWVTVDHGERWYRDHGLRLYPCEHPEIAAIPTNADPTIGNYIHCLKEDR